MALSLEDKVLENFLRELPATIPKENERVQSIPFRSLGRRSGRYCIERGKQSSNSHIEKGVGHEIHGNREPSWLGALAELKQRHWPIAELARRLPVLKLNLQGRKLACGPIGYGIAADA
jgi:hypothetical protein